MYHSHGIHTHCDPSECALAGTIERFHDHDFDGPLPCDCDEDVLG